VMETRTAVEQIVWTTDTYLKNNVPTFALIDHTTIGMMRDCPAGWALRICCLKWDAPGAHAIYETMPDAMRAFETWVSGLDIEEWQATSATAMK
jgi:hypothetical protein